MKKYLGNMKKYVGSMKDYEEISRKYEEICERYGEIRQKNSLALSLRFSLIHLSRYDLLVEPKNEDFVPCLSSLASRLLSEFFLNPGAYIFKCR